jgi:hypothetical protein
LGVIFTFTFTLDAILVDIQVRSVLAAVIAGLVYQLIFQQSA